MSSSLEYNSRHLPSAQWLCPRAVCSALLRADCFDKQSKSISRVALVGPCCSPAVPVCDFLRNYGSSVCPRLPKSRPTPGSPLSLLFYFVHRLLILICSLHCRDLIHLFLRSTGALLHPLLHPVGIPSCQVLILVRGSDCRHRF